ncbi:MAG: hypothetical protein WC516_09000 [Patescibacteria group bacterium]|jgi:hypothetical protein
MANSSNYYTIRKVINKYKSDVSYFKKEDGQKHISNEDVFKININFNTYRLKDIIIKQNLIPYACAKYGLIDTWCN